MTSEITRVSARPRGRARAYLKRLYKARQLYLLILPAMAAVFIFHYIPIYGVQIAFKNFRTSKGIWGSEWVGLANFKRFFEYPDFWNILLNTVTISLYGIATFPCSLVFALMINELNSTACKKTVQMATYAPHFVSTVVVVAMVSLFFDRSNGLVNNVIAALGGERVAFISSPGCFSSLYVWSGVWQGLGWGTIIYMAALANISVEMIEAARIDGASRWQIVTRINLPSIMPTVVVLLILNTGGVLSVGFEKIYLMQNPLNLAASQVISTYVYNVGLVNNQYSYSSAVGLFNNVVNIVVIMLVNLLAKRVTSIGLW